MVGLGKSKGGVKPSNLRRWTEPEFFAIMEEACRLDPNLLNAANKHKGGRGKTKPGRNKTLHQAKRAPYFEELERKLDVKIVEQRLRRLRVKRKDVKVWMTAIVTKEIKLQKENETTEVDSRLQDFKCSNGWVRRFFQRWGWTHRRATNKRSHSIEDLLGSLLGFVRALRTLRQENATNDDPIWGSYGKYTTFNADSVPIPFCDTSKTTVERKASKRVPMIVPGSGLDKRQMTLHIAIRACGPQPWPTIIVPGATQKDGKDDTKKRQKEMARYKV
jgi:hypothetical protein